MSELSASALSADTLERIASATTDVFPRAITACVFGSAARGEMRPFSDIDLGLLLPDEPDLMDLGELAGRVEDISRRPVDIVRLRGLPESDPELAFRIADEGVPILESRRYAFADFKKEAFLWYIDTAPLRRMMKQALYERIRSGNMGRRNYV
ncbi:MAG: type VII toxin-antitoxin system MntA family adenylyltransferase antitoxin [Spirochaetota bacterium]